MSSIPERWYITDLRVKMLATSTPRLCQRKHGKRVENCHVAIICREDFERVAAMRKGNKCAGAERKHETHCLTGKMICGKCGHRLSHSYSGRPKY